VKIVIFGNGLIGSQVATTLREAGHDAVALGRGDGIDTTTGQGVAEAVAGADVVVDLTNSPSWADDDVLAFFRDSTAHTCSPQSRRRASATTSSCPSWAPTAWPTPGTCARS
jgi:nucleoside-diphosphate-sugar epimerase